MCISIWCFVEILGATTWQHFGITSNWLSWFPKYVLWNCWLVTEFYCSDLPLPSGSNADERLLRERRPTTQNRSEILLLMESTRSDRRAWIEKDLPSITEILRRYPRFLDVSDTVSWQAFQSAAYFHVVTWFLIVGKPSWFKSRLAWVSEGIWL